MPIQRYRRPRRINHADPAWPLRTAQLAADQPRKRLYRTYDMTMNEIAALHASQRGRCANLACGELIPPFGRGRAMDHDENGKAHGMLCKSCSLGLGLFGRDQRRMRGAIEYLERVAARNKVAK